MEHEMTLQEKKRLIRALMAACGVKDSRTVETFLIKCSSESDMENSIRQLRKNGSEYFWPMVSRRTA